MSTHAIEIDIGHAEKIRRTKRRAKSLAATRGLEPEWYLFRALDGAVNALRSHMVTRRPRGARGADKARDVELPALTLKEMLGGPRGRAPR